MLIRIKMVLLILLCLTLVGCGTSTGKAEQEKSGTNQTPSSSTQQNSETAQEPKAVLLTPIPSGTPLVEANSGVSKQIMAQKDVIGTQIYNQQGIIFGDITFKSDVAKDYAHDLVNEFLTQLKASYPGRQITAQVVIDGKTVDSISFNP